jgi:ABC-type multidrug transport system fused ATPase/permease subunit
MIRLAPIWASSNASSWRRHALWALVAALAEAGIGFWMRRIATLPDATLDGIRLWMAGLAALLAARVVFSWRRDAWRERCSLDAGKRFHDRLWTASEKAPAGLDNSWLGREGREWIESGTRAAAEMRTAVATMAILLPALLWLAPWLAVSVALFATGLGWVAQRRSKAGKGIAEQERTEAQHEARFQDWAWRAMPEATGSGLGPAISHTVRDLDSSHTYRRMRRSAALMSWGALGETAAHLGGWSLAAISLAAWKFGWMPAGNLVAFLGVSLLAYRPVREAGRLAPQIQRAGQVWERLSQFEQRTTDSVATGNARLVVEGMSAGWDPVRPVLENLSITLEPGSIAVAIGPNGCGKSTFLAALAGNCPHVAVRATLPGPRRWMAQEPVLPPLAPAAWIGEPRGETLELLFPDGLPLELEWNSSLPDGGQKLSRGQRSRLALLAVASEPTGTWLLDEPMSALPADQRRQILTCLLASRGRAIVLLAEPVLPDGLEEVALVWGPAPGQGGPRIVLAKLA